MKEVDLGEPTSFFDHVYLGCTQRECKISKDIVDKLQRFVSIQDISWRHGKLRYSEKSESNISSWSCDTEGHAKKCVERYCELANKATEQLYKVATPCMDDHQQRERRKWISWKRFPIGNACSYTVKKSYSYLCMWMT